MVREDLHHEGLEFDYVVSEFGLYLGGKRERRGEGGERKNLPNIILA